jgi:hypothetical protein
MERRFVVEAIMFAVYGQLLQPGRPVEYIVPYSTIMELYDLREMEEPVMPEAEEDKHVKMMIQELIRFFEEPLNRKKVERALGVPWRKSSSLPVNEHVTITVVYSVDNAQYGESFDPIETEMILTSLHESSPIVTDQLELVEKIIEAEIPVEVYDIEDFDYALEDDGMN